MLFSETLESSFQKQQPHALSAASPLVPVRKNTSLAASSFSSTAIVPRGYETFCNNSLIILRQAELEGNEDEDDTNVVVTIQTTEPKLKESERISLIKIYNLNNTVPNHFFNVHWLRLGSRLVLARVLSQSY
ncbi:hypothetical protein ACA910_006446 [Epithemia clementina (nom. ined.)]